MTSFRNSWIQLLDINRNVPLGSLYSQTSFPSPRGGPHKLQICIIQAYQPPKVSSMSVCQVNARSTNKIGGLTLNEAQPLPLGEDPRHPVVTWVRSDLANTVHPGAS